jgi:hypothetical protein
MIEKQLSSKLIYFLDERLPPRFWAKVAPCPVSGCWLWFASTLKNGYGSLGVLGTTEYAHRHSYKRLVGEIPDGMQLDHLCRVRCCVNPAHLEAVTQQENLRRGEAGAHNAAKTHCPSGHPYSGDNLRYARNMSRICRACQKHHIATHKARRS